MRVLSLFNGISCGRVALAEAGIAVERYVSFEIDEVANQIAKFNFPLDEYHGDVCVTDFSSYAGFDLLLGGSPCTDWSIAKVGRTTGPVGKGWKLFMHYKRALVESGCRYFLYENNYSIHSRIRDAISAELGVQPIMLDSALLSAQRRQRLYWTNIHDEIIPPSDKRILLSDIIEDGWVGSEKSSTLIASYYKVGMNVFSNFNSDRTQPRVYNLADHSSEYDNIAVDVRDKIAYGANNCQCALNIPDGRYYPRKLTQSEAERLQTLPAGYTQVASYSPAIRCIGNGWTVAVIAYILGYLNM